MLFGIGFTLQLSRLGAAEGPGDVAAAAAGGSSGAPPLATGHGATLVYARRLAVLLGIGLVHAALLWPGDVLLVYAVLGFALLALRRLPDAAVLALLALCLVYPAASDALRTVAFSFETETIAAFEYQDFEASNDLAFGHGGFLDAVRETARVFAWSYTSPLGLFSCAAFYVQMATGILAGFLIGRRGWVAQLNERGGEVRRAQVGALAIVVAAAVVELSAASGLAGFPAVSFAGGLARTVGRAALAAFYAFTVLRCVTLPGAAPWFTPFAIAGRMPLSNYLLQTVLASAVFYGWGLGLWGRAGPAFETVLALALFFAVQLPFSRAWLSRFRHGPVEYLWRRLTYGRNSV